MSKPINFDKLHTYLSQKSINISIADTKLINLNFKIEKNCSNFLEFLCNEEFANTKTKSELINHIIENVIENVFNNIDDAYVQWKIAQTIDTITAKKYNYSRKRNFSWEVNVLGNKMAEWFDLDMYENQEYYANHYRKLHQLLINYRNEVLENESSQ